VDPVRRDLSGRDPAEQALGVVGGVPVGHVGSLGESPIRDKTTASARLLP
jgi:hypothetical protein